MNIARSSLRIFLANVFSTFIVFIGITYFARELGSHQMGVFFLFQAVLSLITILADFGIGLSTNKRISEGETPGSIFSTAILLKLAFISPFILFILIFQEYINNYLGADLALYLIAVLILQESARLVMENLKGELRVGEIAGPVFARKLSYIVVGGVLVGAGFGITGIISGLIVGLALMLLWGVYKTSTNLAPPSLDHARSLLNYSKYAFVLSVEGTFYNWMDIAILGYLLTQSAVGVYEMAWRVTAITMLFSRSIATTIFPQVSQWDAENSREKIESLLSKVMAPVLFISIPSLFGVLFLSREILGLLFGPEYVAGWIVLIILMFEKTLRSVHIIFARSLQGIDRPDLAAKASIIAMLINIVMNIVLIIQIGIVGAAIATALSFIINTFLHIFYLSKFIYIEVPYLKIGWCVVNSIIMSVCILSVESMFAIKSLPRLITIVLFGVILYAGLAMLVRPLREMVFEFHSLKS